MNDNQKIISLSIITLLVSVVAALFTWTAFGSTLLTLFGSAAFFCGMIAGYGCYLAVQLTGDKDEK